MDVDAMSMLRLDVVENVEVLLATENETCDFAAFELLVEGDGPESGGLDLQVNSDGSGGATVSVQGSPPATGATLKVLVPEKFGVDVTSAGGAVTLARIEGPITISTQGGAIATDKVSEGPVTIQSRGGDVHCRVLNCDAQVDTAGGSFQSKRMQGLDFTVRTGDGDVDVAAMYANTADVETQGGAIAIGSLHAVTHLRSGEGHITIKTGADGDLAIHTAHGDVNVQLGMAISRLAVEATEGDIKISAPLKLAASPVTLHGKQGVQVDPGFESQIQYDGATATGSIGDQVAIATTMEEGVRNATSTARGFVARTVELEARAPGGRVEIVTQGWLASLGIGGGKLPTFD